MGNFCARCGRPLQGGEACNCMTQNTFYGGQQGQVQASASQSQMGYQIPPVQPQMGYQMPPLQQTTGQSASGRQGTGGKADQITGNLLGILKRPVTMGSEAIAVADLKTAFIFFAFRELRVHCLPWSWVILYLQRPIRVWHIWEEERLTSHILER